MQYDAAKTWGKTRLVLLILFLDLFRDDTTRYVQSARVSPPPALRKQEIKRISSGKPPLLGFVFQFPAEEQAERDKRSYGGRAKEVNL